MNQDPINWVALVLIALSVGLPIYAIRRLFGGKKRQ